MILRKAARRPHHIKPAGRHSAKVRSFVCSILGLIAFVLAQAQVRAQQIVPRERAILKNPFIIPSVSFAPNSKIVATASDNVVKVWDVQEAKEIATLDDFRRGVACIAFSPDGKTIATTGFEEPARLYDTRTWKVRHRLHGEEESTRCVAFSPDGKLLATVGLRDVVAFWDVATGNQLKSINLGVKHLRAVSFSPDGATMAAGAYGETVLWDLKKNKIRARLPGQESTTHSLIFSRDGKTLYTADSAVLAKLLAWDTATGKLKTELLNNLPIRGISLSPDGETVALVGNNPHVHLLDAATGKPWAQLRKFGIGIEYDSVAFSPDGRLIIAGGADGGARIWEVPKKRRQEHAL